MTNVENLEIFGLIAPPRMDGEPVAIKGKKIAPGSSIHSFILSNLEILIGKCDMKIKFIPKEDAQENDIRTMILAIMAKRDMESCRALVEKLSEFTNRKTKDGLVFIVIGEHEKEQFIFLARYPSEAGITIDEGTKSSLQINVLDEVFFQQSRKLKAVYYASENPPAHFWDGFAADRQINDFGGKIREISEYWIRNFLQSELVMTPQRGSRLLAKAIRETLNRSEDPDIKDELISLGPLSKSKDRQSVSIESFLTDFGVSLKTKNSVLARLENVNVAKTTFQFDLSAFSENYNFRFNYLDNNAIVIAPAENFDDIWNKREVAEQVYEYSTSGAIIKEKVSSRA